MNSNEVKLAPEALRSRSFKASKPSSMGNARARHSAGAVTNSLREERDS